MSHNSRLPGQQQRMAGVVQAMLLVTIIPLGFDLFLPDILNNAVVGAFVTGQALEILKGRSD